MWTRGITTGDRYQPNPKWVRPQNLKTRITAGLITLVEQLGYIGTDGAGGKLSKSPKHRHVGAGPGVCVI